MIATDALQPLAADRFGLAEAKHLLNRAGFGGSFAEVRRLADMGLDAAVAHLIDYERIDDSDLPRPEYERIRRNPTTAERIMRRQARMEGDFEKVRELQRDANRLAALDRQQMGQLRQWWLSRMIATPRPLEEKLTLLWHGHFASNHRAVGDSVLMIRQHNLFRAGGKYHFSRLAASIVRDPAMLKFLNNNSNRRRQPNENLARELLELFTLGEGNYSEQDIREGARALTGYHVSQAGEFHLSRSHHDTGLKTIFGKTARFSGDDFVRLCIEHPACSRFIAYKLYCWFVRDVQDLPQGPDDSAQMVITALAQQLVQHRFNIAPVLRTLFTSAHFYDPACRGCQIKSPAQLIAGTARTLQTPSRGMAVLDNAMRHMGQTLFDPPNVQGWPGGRTWINTSRLFTRQNVAAYLITGKPPGRNNWSRQRIDYDPTVLLKDAPVRTPSAIVEHLGGHLLNVPLHPSRRDQLATYFTERSAGKPDDRDALIDLLLLITALPEYQLC